MTTTARRPLPRLLDPRRWRNRDVLPAGLLLALALEAVAAFLRFGLGLQSTRDTSFLAPYTFGVRVHHGYLGLPLLAAAWVVRRPPVLRRWLVAGGIGLVVSDLLHHFAVLWPITGSPHFDLVYPGEPGPVPDWLPTDPKLWAGVEWASEWVIRVVMLGVVPVRRPVAAGTAWLLLIFLLPWPGLALFFLIGSADMPAWRRRKLARFAAAVRPLGERAAAALPDHDARPPEPWAAVAELARRLSRMPVVPGNRVEFLGDTDQTFARLAADIDAARHHAHLLFYIAAADHATEPVMAALARAAGRGVRCRLLYDSHGSKDFSGGLHKRLAGSGVEVRAALPVRWLGVRGTRADLRNHRKLAVLDGRVGYAGSLNLVDKVFKPGIVYEDYTARVEGAAVVQMQLVFAGDWWLEAGERLDEPDYFPPAAEPGAVEAQLVPSGPDFPTQNFQRVLVDAVHQARDRVTLVTPYLVPDDGLLQAFDTAAHRGVTVRVIVSRVADQKVVRLCQESFYAGLLASGVRIYRYNGPFLHAKMAVADGGLAVVGSSNADVRSFRLNAEANLLIYDADTVKAVAARCDHYVSHSDRLTKEAWDARPRWRRLPENLARIWSPLM